MKKIIYLVTLFLFSVYSFGASNEKFDLKYNFKSNETFNQNVKVKVVGTYGEEATITVMDLGYSATVKDIKNNYDLEFKYNKISTQMTMAGEEMSFSSEKPYKKDSQTMEDMMGNMMNTVFKNMTNQPFNIIIDKKGNMVDIKNLDNLFNHITDNLDEYFNEEEKEAYREEMKSSFKENFVDESMSNSFVVFPSNPVAIGDTWDGTVNINGKDGNYTYKLVKADKKQWVIEVTGNSTSDFGGEYLEGELKGTYTFDAKNGWLLEAKIIENLSNEYGVKYDTEVTIK